MFRAVLVITLVGCSGGQRGGPGSPQELGCTQDPATRSACEAQGSGFVYAAAPDFSCGGDEPDPESQKEIAAAELAHPCECMSNADYAQRQHKCRIAP